MADQNSNQPPSDNFSIKALALCLSLASFTAIFWLINNPSIFHNRDRILLAAMTIVGVILTIFSLTDKMTPSGATTLKMKYQIRYFLTALGVAITASAFILEIMVYLENRAAVQHNSPNTPYSDLIRQLAREFHDTAKADMSRLPSDTPDDYDYQHLKATVQAIRIDALNKILENRNTDPALRPAYRTAILDSIRTDTLALYCDNLDSLQTVAREANSLMHGSDLDAVKSFVNRHHISQDARILRRVGLDMVSVGPVVGTLLDAVQYGRPMRLQAVWSKDRQDQPIIEFVVISKTV